MKTIANRILLLATWPFIYTDQPYIWRKKPNKSRYKPNRKKIHTQATKAKKKTKERFKNKWWTSCWEKLKILSSLLLFLWHSEKQKIAVRYFFKICLLQYKCVSYFLYICFFPKFCIYGCGRVEDGWKFSATLSCKKWRLLTLPLNLGEPCNSSDQ